MATLTEEYEGIGDDANKLVHALTHFGADDVPGADGKENEQEADEDEHDEIQVAGTSKGTLQKPTLPKPAEKKSAKRIKHLLRSSRHTVYASDGREHELTSWKMADYAYKRDPCPFPTRARGLFTEQTKTGKHKIVCRAYDKFFNVNEVSWTKWENIPNYSEPPYELTRKSNGCIILIAALTDKDLIVTSKHSVGGNTTVRTESGLSHAQMGEKWLLTHLERAGRTKEQLATELWNRNMTAVAELCDDSFEEHVLPYPDEQTGLHLHGLVLNLPRLYSMPSTQVSRFARDWGMIETPFLLFDSLDALRTYCNDVEKAGGVEEVVNGRKVLTPVEGFVARGKRKGATHEGEVFMWKIKYDEPYLMYREWRELTRKILAAKDKNDESVNISKVRNKESKLYAWWVEREIRKDASKFESWKYGKGMIKTREEFLAWRETNEGQDQARQLGLVEGFAKLAVDDSESANDTRPYEKTLIVPIAVPGCGKTKVALELCELFGWGHTQSDDFLVKKPAPHFLKAVQEGLAKSQVWIADKNNHTVKHREDLISLAKASPERVRLVALVWSLDGPRDTLHGLLASRIEERGANHQTLRAGEGHEAVLWQFLSQYEAFDPVVGVDASFDEHFKIDPAWSRSECLDRVLDFFCPLLGLDQPSTESKNEAIRKADEYVPRHKKAVSQKEQEKLKARTAPRYYGLSVDVDLRSTLAPLFAHLPSEEKKLWDWLEANDRIEKKPHITLVHESDLSHADEQFRQARRTIWQNYERLMSDASQEVRVAVKLGPRVVYDDKVISIEAFVEPDERIEAASRHVTVGFAEGSRGVEGKLILESLLKGEDREGRKVLEMDDAIHVHGTLKGMR